MQIRSPALGLGLWRRVLLLVPLSVFFYSSYSQAQDVTETARPERVRKAEQKQKSPHVYTDEDLKRDRILTPEDQEKAETQKKPKAPSFNNPENAEALPLAPAEPGESLGAIARGYRKEKEEREAAEAAKKKIAPFPYTAPEPTWASPHPEITPLVLTSPEAPVHKPREISPFVRPHVPSGASSRARISPFQPRPLLAMPDAPPVLATPPAPPVAPRVAPRVEGTWVANAAPVRETTGLREIQVRRGDSWWKLAAQYLGRGARWRELRKLNPDTLEPAESLSEGSLVRVPETPNEHSSSSHPDIVVKKGDTLWTLAHTYLGHSHSWSCLATANPQIPDFTRLAIGSVLHLPDAAVLQSCEHSISGSSSR